LIAGYQRISPLQGEPLAPALAIVRTLSPCEPFLLVCSSRGVWPHAVDPRLIRHLVSEIGLGTVDASIGAQLGNKLHRRPSIGNAKSHDPLAERLQRQP
jgi:hypothetical protein